MRITRVDDTLEACQSHLDSVSHFNAEINALLACSSLVITYAEFERTVMDILQEKCDFITDEAIRRFTYSFLSTMNRRIYTSNLSDVLRRFGDTYKNEFTERIKEAAEYERAETAYNNIIANRNNAAHSTGCNMTFEEIRAAYIEGHVVLDFFREVLLPTNPNRSE